MYEQVARQVGFNWELQEIVPPRSIFYSLVAKARNTPLVESLTGYLRRLAAEHGAPVIDLICHEHFEDLFPASADRRTQRHAFLAEAYLLDGSESFSGKWTKRIEAGTVQKDLHHLTLLPFVGATHASWLRRRRAWCTRCLMEWDIASEELYDPLIWSIRLVRVCPIDLTPIAQICPHCSKSATPFAGKPFPGFCGHCGGKLWEGKRADRTGSGLPDKYAIWCASEMLAVIGILAEFTVPLTQGSVANVLAEKVASVEKTSLTEKLAVAGCSKRSSYLWADASASPRVETLFRLCFHLGLRPVDLLREALRSSCSTGIEKQSCNGVSMSQQQLQEACPSGNAEPSKRAVEVCTTRSHSVPVIQYSRGAARQMILPFAGTPPSKRVRYEQGPRLRQIRAALAEALLSEPPPTLNAVAVSLGISSSTRLRELEPELSGRLTQLHQTWKQREEATIRGAFEFSIDSTRPVSLEMFCKDQGISYSVIRRKYPDLKDAYTSRFRILRRKAKDARSTERAIAVAQAVNKTLRVGGYPSVAKVKSMAPELKSAGWDEIQEAIRSAVSISKQKEEVTRS